jgi:hypothetical protein
MGVFVEKVNCSPYRDHGRPRMLIKDADGGGMPGVQKIVRALAGAFVLVTASCATSTPSPVDSETVFTEQSQMAMVAINAPSGAVVDLSRVNSINDVSGEEVYTLSATSRGFDMREFPPRLCAPRF